MPGYRYCNPADPTQWMVTLHRGVGVPPGWQPENTDGSQARDMQEFRAGTASGGFPTWPPIAGQQTPNPDLGALRTNLRTLNGTPNDATSTVPTTLLLIWDEGSWDINEWGA